MTKRYIALILWIGGFLMMTACDDFFIKEVKLDDVDIENKLVVQSFISPQDTVIKVVVRYAENAIGAIPKGKKSTDEVSDALVKLSDGSSTVTLTFDDISESYLVSADDFPIIAGKTYQLKVSVAGYDQIKATCTVPTSKVNSENIEVTVPKDWSDGILLGWNDEFEKDNYYRIIILDIREDSVGDIEIEHSYGVGLYKSTGKKQLMTRLFYPRSKVIYNDGASTYSLALLANVDYNYYEFHRTFGNQIDGIEISSGIPLSVYTNIEGGFGVFGAYNGVLFSFD